MFLYFVDRFASKTFVSLLLAARHQKSPVRLSWFSFRASTCFHTSTWQFRNGNLHSRGLFERRIHDFTESACFASPKGKVAEHGTEGPDSHINQSSTKSRTSPNVGREQHFECKVLARISSNRFSRKSHKVSNIIKVAAVVAKRRMLQFIPEVQPSKISSKYNEEEIFQ